VDTSKEEHPSIVNKTTKLMFNKTQDSIATTYTRQELVLLQLQVAREN